MPIHVTCETCGRLLRGPDDFACQQTICPVCQRPMMLPGAEAANLPTPSPMPVLTSLEVVPAGQAPIEPLAGNRATRNLALDIRQQQVLYGKGKIRIGLILGGQTGWSPVEDRKVWNAPAVEVAPA